MQTIGDRIKNLRQKYEMTQEELGIHLGLNRAAVNKYEKGTVTNIPIDSILKMCSMFEVTPNYLLLGQADCDVKDIMKDIRLVLGENGIKCYTMLQMISNEGLLRIIPYLEDMMKLYPADKSV